MKQTEDKVVFLERRELDLGRYNFLVEQSENVSVYQQSWYLDNVADKWGVVVLGDYKTIFPICYTIKFGQRIIYQPFFTREFNFVGEEPSSIIALKMLKEGIQQSKKIHFCSHYQFNSLEELKKEEYSFQALVLKKKYEIIKKEYSTNTRRLIKKAQKAGLKVLNSKEVENFVSFFKEHTGERVNYNSRHYRNIENLMQEALIREKGFLLIAKDEEERIVAQAFYLIHKKRVFYLKGSANDFGKKHGAMFLLMDSVIKQYSEKYQKLDFGGSRIESIARFYKKFGAEDESYFQYWQNELPWVLKKGKKIKEIFKK